MRPIFDNIPQELKDRPQWVLWKRERETKVPYRTLTKRASTTDPTQWQPYDAVVARFCNSDFDGIGYVFSADDPFTGIDIDHCIVDGKLNDMATGIVKALHSYAEISPSGKGVKLIVKAKKPGERSKDTQTKIELYDQGRYFTITGNKLNGSTIRDSQKELDAIYSLLFSETEKQQAEPQPSNMEDQELLAKIQSSQQGEKFRKLWQGDLSDHNHDHSSADLALCCILAFWTGGDVDQIDRLFRQSGLMRDKWERTDYRERTIERAISGCEEFYTPEETFSDQELAEQTSYDPPAKPKRIFTLNEMMQRPPASWLIEEHLIAGGSTCVLADSGTGKTFYVADMLHAVATGRNYQGQWQTTQGAAIYVGAEEQSMVHYRFEALCRHYKQRPDNLFFIPEDFDLTDIDQTQTLIEIMGLHQNLWVRNGGRGSGLSSRRIYRIGANPEEREEKDAPR